MGNEICGETFYFCIRMLIKMSKEDDYQGEDEKLHLDGY